MKLKKLIDRVEQKFIEMNSAVEDVEAQLDFRGDFDEMPIVSMTGTGELIASYHGKEIDKNDMIACMSMRGYIIPRDFY